LANDGQVKSEGNGGGEGPEQPESSSNLDMTFALNQPEPEGIVPDDDEPRALPYKTATAGFDINRS